MRQSSRERQVPDKKLVWVYLLLTLECLWQNYPSGKLSSGRRDEHCTIFAGDLKFCIVWSVNVRILKAL